MGNHLCFAWEETKAVFSGDLVMGWATSMVSPPDGSLSDFMDSLRVLAQRPEDKIYYPGHGAEISDPLSRVQELLSHRQTREGQILAALEGIEASPAELAAKIYTEIDPALLPAATRNVLAHLIDLTSRNIIIHDGKLSADAIFRLS
jgi:glyoxylase-like metal-dependent hydrolase (beta-lactamase superfamily II)